MVSCVVWPSHVPPHRTSAPYSMTRAHRHFLATTAFCNSRECLSLLISTSQALEAQPELRSKLGSTSSLASIYEVAESVLKLEVEEAAQSPDLMNARCDVPGSPFVSWYRRHRPYTIGSCLGDEPIPANAHP
eukprot:scaffold64190_cov32-Tisochrysis_lutea.AAC.1